MGKTTLARRLATSMGAGLVLEQPAENPFLERFYKNPQQYALQTQLYFLFQRVQQLKSLRQGDIFTPQRIADFMLAKDPIFARLTLDEDELHLYEQVYKQLAPEAPTPDLVVYLQAPTEALVKRIRKRGILFERNMQRDYLDRLSDSYLRYFLNYVDSPLLIVNAGHLDLVSNDSHYNTLLEQIDSIDSGRNYFNPMI